MAKIILPFHSYQHRSRQVCSRRLVNCYAETLPTQAKSPLCLMSAPGTQAVSMLPDGSIRCMYVHQDTLYVACGDQVYSVDSDGVGTAIGTIDGTGRVTMASNRTQLIIVCDPFGYIWDGTSFTQISDPDFTDYGAGAVATLDGFALFIVPGSDRFFCSAFEIAEDYDGFGYGIAEGAPDELVTLLVDRRQIFLFGTHSIEVWYNSGGDPVFPFVREQNGYIMSGCGAAESVVAADNSIFWLDDKRVARRLVDYTPTRISTYAIEQQWSNYATISDARSHAFVHEGHWFWCLTFPSAPGGGDTFIFDIATGEWHERRSRDLEGHDGAWRAYSTAFCYGQTWVGDTLSPALGVIDSDVRTEWGNPVRMEWTYPSIYTDGRRAFHSRLEINFEAGVGLSNGQGSDPQVMLYSSDNGGKTFSRLPNRTIGRIGEYRTRAAWHRLGSSRDRVYRAAVSDPVRVTVWDTQVELSGGRL